MAESTLSLLKLFQNWKGEKHQVAAVQELEKDIAVNGIKVALNRGRKWYETWANAPISNGQDYSAALNLIIEFESFESEAYPDPLTKADPWTIGYGTTVYPNGSRVRKGDKITEKQSKEYLLHEVDSIVGTLEKKVPYWSQMNPNQRSALISFAYNLGAGFFNSSGFNTISSRLRNKEWDKVPEALLLYRNPGTHVEAGLLRRRKAEGKLWSS